MIALLKRISIRAYIARNRIYAAFNFIPSVRTSRFILTETGENLLTEAGEVIYTEQ